MANDDNSGDFAFGGDDVPEQIQELLRKMISRSMLTGNAHDAVAEQVRPSQEQFDLGPGDFVSVSNSEDGGGSVICAARLLDPNEYAEDFPDWEERVLNSFVLGTWYTPDQLQGELGWFARSKLVKLSPAQFSEFFEWIKNGEVPNPVPAWIAQRYNEVVIGLNEANEDFMPNPLKCGGCGSLAQVLDVSYSHRSLHSVGRFRDKEGKDPNAYYAASQHSETEKRETLLRCLNCGATEDVDGVEIFFHSGS